MLAFVAYLLISALPRMGEGFPATRDYMLLLLALAIILAKGYRLPLAGVAAFAVWMNYGIIFVATMAVSGVWL